MESLVNYSSEDDQESDVESRSRDILGERSTRKVELKKTNHTHKNYEYIRADSSENSNLSGNHEEHNDNDLSIRLKQSNNVKQSQKKNKKEIEKKKNSTNDDRYRSRYRDRNHREEKNRYEDNKNKERERVRERERDRNRDHDRNRNRNNRHFRDDYATRRYRHERGGADDTGGNNRRNHDEYRLSREERRNRDDCREREKDKYRCQNRDYNDKSDRSHLNKESHFLLKNHRNQESPTKMENKKDKKNSSYIRSKSQERDRNQTLSPSKSSLSSLYQNESVLNKDEQKLLSSSSSSSIISASPVIACTKAFSSINENKSESTITLPSYYNPNVINPNKYAEQVQKRKLLWSNKKADDVTNKWGKPTFAQDTDGKVASKFMRLMGIKSATKIDESITSTGNNNTNESIKKREEMFSSMEQQYEVARQATHTMRGVGLGFGSQPRQF